MKSESLGIFLINWRFETLKADSQSVLRLKHIIDDMIWYLFDINIIFEIKFQFIDF